MLIIAHQNTIWQGEYFKHDNSWRNSNLCIFAGVISTISSEVSVFTLTVITIDRLICTGFDACPSKQLSYPWSSCGCSALSLPSRPCSTTTISETLTAMCIFTVALRCVYHSIYRPKKFLAGNTPFLSFLVVTAPRSFLFSWPTS